MLDEGDPKPFIQKTRELLNHVVDAAIIASKMYSLVKIPYGKSNIFYLWRKQKELSVEAQCSRDLNSVNCTKCLGNLIMALPKCCDGNTGGKV